MNTSGPKILLKEVTDEELISQGYKRIGASAVSTKKKEGCTVKSSESGKYYAKCKAEPVKPPKPPVKPTDPNKPKVDEPKPTEEPKTKDITIYDIDKGIADASTFFTFYTTNVVDEQIYWLNSDLNTDFKKDPRLIDIVKRAKNIKESNKYGKPNDFFAYLKAVIMSTGNLVGSFELDNTKTSNLDAYKTTRLDENKIFQQLRGLQKLLVESSANRTRYFIKLSPSGGKYIGDVKNYNDRGTLDVTWVVRKYKLNDNEPIYFTPLSLKSDNGLPDKAPIIGEVKEALKISDGTNIFTESLKKAIEDYRKQSPAIRHDLTPGDIDFPLIFKLFKSRFGITQNEDI